MSNQKDNGEITSEDDTPQSDEDTHSSDSDEDCQIVKSEVGDLLMIKRLLSSSNKDLETSQRENIFHTRSLVAGNVCSVIIDAGSCANVASSRLVSKLRFNTLPHPRPYKLRWLNEGNELVVSKQVLVPF